MFPLSFWNFGKWNSFGRDGELLLLLYVHIFFFSPLLGEVLAPVFGGVCVCVCVCVEREEVVLKCLFITLLVPNICIL